MPAYRRLSSIYIDIEIANRVATAGESGAVPDLDAIVSSSKEAHLGVVE